MRATRLNSVVTVMVLIPCIFMLSAATAPRAAGPYTLYPSVHAHSSILVPASEGVVDQLGSAYYEAQVFGTQTDQSVRPPVNSPIPAVDVPLERYGESHPFPPFPCQFKGMHGTFSEWIRVHTAGGMITRTIYGMYRRPVSTGGTQSAWTAFPIQWSFGLPAPSINCQ